MTEVRESVQAIGMAWMHDPCEQDMSQMEMETRRTSVASSIAITLHYILFRNKSAKQHVLSDIRMPYYHTHTCIHTYTHIHSRVARQDAYPRRI